MIALVWTWPAGSWGEATSATSCSSSAASASVKYRVLTPAKGRCECCGAHEHQRALKVNHIVPRNHGGYDDLNNLQALCFRCNAGDVAPFKRHSARGGLCVRELLRVDREACRSRTCEGHC
ncbi:MAG: HNH endonuclease [Synechococcus sp.]